MYKSSVTANLLTTSLLGVFLVLFMCARSSGAAPCGRASGCAVPPGHDAEGATNGLDALPQEA